MNILIKNGRVLDPDTNTDEILDVLVCGGVIKERKKYIDESTIDADKIIDAKDLFVMPGLIDLHVHLREPGFENKGTIESETKAMAKGGYTTVCPMPNTKPAIDNAEMVTWLINKAKEVSPINILPVGAVTINQEGKELVDFESMKKAGIVAISEDGKSVMDSYLYREAMKEAKRLDLIVMAHCEDKKLAGKGCINLGEKSKEYGVEGISNAVEDIITARDIMLAKETGAKLHLCHCSTKDSVRMVKEAKEDKINVTAEVCPHHFGMCSDDIKSDSANYKMNPPLRNKEDMETLKMGLRDGIMDVISTDHAPHTEEEKNKPITDAPFGIIGTETAVGLTITKLVNTGMLTPIEMAAKMSYNPANILGIEKGSLKVGKTADITIINPKEEYVVTREDTISKGKNTPFMGEHLTGRVKYTIVNGNVVYEDK